MSGKLRPFPSSDSLTARLKRSNQSMERNSASGRAQATAVILHDITVMADKLAKQAFDKSYGQSPRSTDFLGRNVFAFSLSNTVQLRIDGINELPLCLSHLKRLTPPLSAPAWPSGLRNSRWQPFRSRIDHVGFGLLGFWRGEMVVELD